MKELIDLFKKSADAFYLGKDENGWNYFTKLIETMQFYIADEKLDVNFKNVLMAFVVKNNTIVSLKAEKNYPVLADIFYDTYKKLDAIKHFN